MRFSNKLTKTERKHFNAITSERLMAMEEKIVAERNLSLKETRKKHIHAVIFNGLVDAYFSGRDNAKNSRNYKIRKKKNGNK